MPLDRLQSAAADSAICTSFMPKRDYMLALSVDITVLVAASPGSMTDSVTMWLRNDPPMDLCRSRSTRISCDLESELTSVLTLAIIQDNLR